MTTGAIENPLQQSGETLQPDLHPEVAKSGVAAVHEDQALHSALQQELKDMPVLASGTGVPVPIQPTGEIEYKKDTRPPEEAGKWNNFVKNYIAELKKRVAKNKN